MPCILCDNGTGFISVEHIVPESFGNLFYLLPKGVVCDECNNRISNNEMKALANSVFVMERIRLGAKSKKGRSAKGNIRELTFTGDESLDPGLLTVNGLSNNNFQDFNPETGEGKLHIKTFDKSEVATSRMLLKIGFESIFKSQLKDVFKKKDFKELKEYLTNKTNKDWPFVVTNFEKDVFVSVPRFIDKWRLKIIHCELKLSEINDETLLFKFKYGAVAMVINLFDRNLKWIKGYLPNKKDASLYPERFNSKLI